MALYNTTLSISSPAPLSAVGNPVIFNIETLSSSGGTYSEGYIRVDETPTDGFYIRFQLDNLNYDKTFYARDYPYPTDSYFYTDHIENSTGGTVITGITVNQVANSLYETLSSDPVLTQHYFITYDAGRRVYLKAKTQSNKYRLTGGRLSSSNGSIATIFNPEQGQSQFEGGDITEYSLYAELISVEGEFGDNALSNDSKITELVLPFSQDNQHKFDFSNIIKSYLTTTRPDPDATGWSIDSNWIKPYSINYGEIYPLFSNATVKRKWSKGTSPIFYVGNFGSNNHYLSNSHTSLTGTSISGKIYDTRFISNSPNPKLSYRNSHEFLYFLLKKNVNTALRLYGDITFWDGSSTTDALLLDYLTAFGNTGGLFVSNVSFGALSLDDLEEAEGKKIKQIDVVVKQTTVSTEQLENNSFDNPPTLGLWEANGSNAAWFWSGNSACVNLGPQIGPQLYTGFTWETGFDGWFNTNNLVTPSSDPTRPLWELSTLGGNPALKVTTVDTFQPKSLRLSGFAFPQEPFRLSFDGSSSFFYNSDNMALSILIRDASNNQLFNQQFTQFGSFYPWVPMDITDSNIWENADHMAIVASSTDWEAGDNMYLTNLDVILLSASTTNYTSNVISQNNLSLDSFEHSISVDVSFSSGTGNKVYLQYFDNSNVQIGSTITLLTANSGRFTGTTTINEITAPQIYKVAFWIVGQSGVTQNVVVHKFSLAPTVGSNEFTIHKAFRFEHVEPSADELFEVCFLSTAGVFETFTFRGLKTESLERSAKNYTIPLIPNSNGSYSQGATNNRTYQSEVQRKVIVETGLLDLDTYNWLQELISSNDVYEISDNVNALRIDSIKYQSDSQTSAFGFQVTFIQNILLNNLNL